MVKKITTAEIYQEDKEWLRTLKIKYNINGIKDVIHLIRKMITKYKLKNDKLLRNKL